MDFHSLARKELQALCKKNKIPANMTNVSMADALKALDKVEGLDELINPSKNDSQQSPEKTTKAEPRTAARTSTRRKPVNVGPESSQPLTRTRRTTRRTVSEEAEQENKNVNLLETPAISNSRRRAPAASARRKIDAQFMENEEDEKSNMPETPAMQSSRRKDPAVSTMKNEKSVQKVYGTRQSVRLLEKSLAEMSLKDRSGIEAVKIEGLGEETEEVEKNMAIPAGDSEVLSCQDRGISPKNRSEMNLEVQDDSQEADKSEILSIQNLNQLLENESETKHEVQEDKKTNDHEMDATLTIVQNLDESLENECELQHELDEDNKNVDLEGDSYVLCQDKDQLIKSASAKKLVLQVDNKINDNEIIDCNLKLEMGSKSCTSLDSDGSFSLEDETSEKAVDINHELINENGPNVLTEHSEMLNAELNPEIGKGLNDNQDYSILEEYDNKSTSVIETENVSVEVIDSLTAKVSEVVGESSEMNLNESGGDDRLSEAATEEISDGNSPDEVSDDIETEELSEDGESESEYNELSDDIGSDELSDVGKSETELDEELDDSEDEMSDDSKYDSELDEVSNCSGQYIVSDGSLSGEVSEVIAEVSDGSLPDEVQENDDTGKILKAPLLPEAEYGNSHSINEPESHRFHLQPEKCKEVSDKLVSECMTDNVNVIEAKESDSDKNRDKVADSTVSSPFAADTIQGQFPRPTEPTQRKSSAKKPATSQNIIDPDIINKENIDNSGRKVEPKIGKMKKTVVIDDMSLRQLSKMLKKKLTVANKNNNEEENTTKVENRPALQEVAENFTAATQTEDTN